MTLQYLDITIGLIFIYLLLSLFSTVIMELIATFFRMRASLLKDTIRKMLDYNNVPKAINEFYKKPLITFLGESKITFFGKPVNDNMPSFIEPKQFSRNLIELLTGDKLEELSLEEIKELIEKSDILSEETKEHLKNLIAYSKNSVQQFELELQQWFDINMERANSWYKRKVQYILLLVGFIIAMTFDADTIDIVYKLQQDPKLRMELVNSASDFVANYDTTAKVQVITDSKGKKSLSDIDSIKYKIIQQYKTTINQSNGILGRQNNDKQHKCFVYSFIGYLLTGFAISLGSNFWFDLLKKLINIRGLGKQKENKKKK